MAAIGREGVNHPIQGTGADCLKLAAIDIDRKLEELHPECGIILFCHDELVITCPHTLAERVAALVTDSMIIAAKRYITDLPVEVDTHIEDCWRK